MKEWICLKCHKVFGAGEEYAKCCGEIEPFSPAKHGHLLISSSNAWHQVSEHVETEWRQHPVYERVWQEHFDRGSHGAARILVSFINELLKLTNTSDPQMIEWKALRYDVIKPRVDELEAERWRTEKNIEELDAAWRQEVATRDLRITELESENTTLRAHRCEVGMENPEESLKALMALPPEDLAAINQLFNRKRK
jgi:hypothetical protein